MATTITASSSFTAGVYASTGVACANGRATIPVSWTGLDGYPEIIVETSIDNTSYYPAKVSDEFGNLHPIKLRMERSDGEELIFLDGIYGTTPYCRIVCYQNEATAGTIVFEISAT